MHMHRIGAAALAMALTLLLSVPAQAQQVRITGGGASFPFPLYASWFRHFNRENRGIRINYQSVGSGTGVRNFINHQRVLPHPGRDRYLGALAESAEHHRRPA